MSSTGTDGVQFILGPSLIFIDEVDEKIEYNA